MMEELRLIGYYSSENTKLNPEENLIEEANELSSLLKQSIYTLEVNKRTDEAFKNVIKGNTVFIFKTREECLVAYHTITERVRLSNVHYNKKIAFPVDSAYKSWFVPGEDIMVKRDVIPNVELSDIELAKLENWWDNNDVINCTVHHVTNFGAFVNFDDKTGLIHISNLSWNRIEHPGEILRHGDSIYAVILDVDSDGKIQLGYKQLHKAPGTLKQGDIVIGFIKQILSNAYLVQINNHKSILPFSEAIDASYSESDIVIASVLKNEWNDEKHYNMITISQRSFHDDFANKYNKGDIVMAKIIKLIDNNKFVLLRKGNLLTKVPLKNISKEYQTALILHETIDKLVPLVYLGQNPRTRLVSFDMRPIEKAIKLNELKLKEEAQEAKRIALKNKRIKSIEAITSGIEPGTILEVIVERVTKKGITVRITDDFCQDIPKDELSPNKVISAEDEVFEGEPISVVYIGREDDQLILSRKMLGESKYPDSLYSESMEGLLSTMGISTNKFIGKVIDSNGSYYLTDVMVSSNIGDSDNGKLLVDPITGLRIRVLIHNKQRNLVIDGRYYSVKLGLSFEDYRRKQHNPYMFIVEGSNFTEVVNPYERIVSQSFKKQTSPSSNSSLANLLDTVGQGLYSSKRRMFFELLQNADDCASEDGVQVKFELSDSHFILAHNGLPFNKQDFDSIISAAKSTKSASKKKTGYKGIGFKSVFTNSTAVTIFSGGFKFTFDKYYPLYNSFEDFYFYVNECEDDTNKQKKFLDQFEREYSDFRGVKDIPWQLLPIWLDNLSQEFNNTIFSSSNNVSIGLKMDAKMLDEYHIALLEILKEPKFMLFMRRTNRIQYKDGTRYYSVKKIANPDGSLTLLNSVINDCPREVFHIEVSESIPVNNEAFACAGVRIIKSTRINSAGINESYLAHINELNEIISEVRDIPDRLASSDSIKISFAIKINDDGVMIPIAKSSSRSGSCFYSYLPMNEHRFNLPIYVNADFDLHSDREGVKADSPWNEFLFYHLGKRLIRAVANIASIAQSEYLNLLVASLFDESISETAKLSRAFNRGYLESIQEIPFIINDEGDKVLAEEIIVDSSGLSSFVSDDLFYVLFDSVKRLPSPQIDSSILCNNVFNTQTIKIEDVIAAISDKKSNVEKWVRSAAQTERHKLLEWLHDNDVDSEIVTGLPFISMGDRLVTIDYIIESGKYVLLSANDINVGGVLNKLGLGYISLNEDDILNDYIQQTGKDAFDIISEQLDAQIESINNVERAKNVAANLIKDLTSTDKLILFNYLKNLSGIGDKSIESVPLFSNANNVPTPLCEMVAFRDSAPGFMKTYMISEEDNVPEVQNHLVSNEDEFEKIIWKNRPNLNLHANELLTYCKTSIEPYLKLLISEAASNTTLAELIDYVVQSSVEVQELFLKKMYSIHLDRSEFYDNDSFEYKVISLISDVWEKVKNPEQFTSKIYYGETCIREFSIKDEVRCEYEVQGVKKIVSFSLSKLLPAYENVSAGISKVKCLFKSKISDKLFSARSKSNKEIADEIKKLLDITSGTWEPGYGRADQFLFLTYYFRHECGYISNWVMPITLADQPQDFVSDLMDCMFANKIVLANSPFAYRFHSQICNKYFSNEYASESESIPTQIEKWADSEEKKQYLKENSVKSETSKLIRLRKSFMQNDLIDVDKEDISLSLAKDILSFISNKSCPYPGKNQKDFIVWVYKNIPRCIMSVIDTNLLVINSEEWQSEKYKKWKEVSLRSIFLYDGDMPVMLQYNGVTITSFQEGNTWYDKTNKRIYLSKNKTIDDLLFSLIPTNVEFTLSDYNTLCREGRVSVSQDEIQRKDDKIASLESRVKELENILANRQNAHVSSTSSGISKKDEYAAQIEAQQFLMKQRRDWEFPEGYGERDDDEKPICFSIVTVKNEVGNYMEIVVKSYKKRDEKFHINPEEWDAVVKNNAKLLVYTSFKGKLDIVEIPKEEIVRKQSKIQITFNTSNLDEVKYPHKISEFATLLHYFEKITFDFDDFYISKDAIPVKDIFAKQQGSINIGKEEDI